MTGITTGNRSSRNQEPNPSRMEEARHEDMKTGGRSRVQPQGVIHQKPKFYLNFTKILDSSLELAYKDYVYSSNQCTHACGHYTQVVWADTYKVGCAAQACPKGVADTKFSSNPGIIFVCNYATAGNYPNVHPYRNGKSCSNCNEDKCESNLCRNSTRDALKSYNWRPDWDPALFYCGSFCKALLVIRPVSILLIFLSVFYLQHYYTNLFVYE
ncbi:GLIPR1-like protein 1 [Triplophysa dalaica]|uniref:GLIPR1-like protein 1 n=1 Tax=Triplophysa dalaica TaxID=1582913 RepID=UPI0024E0388C|nr:GLIPR1-like protein 1 [Triplophysa dalaica]